jgi:hypothetical protein
MSGDVAQLQQIAGAYWPYLALFLFGFLPSEIWRWMAAFAVQSISDQSEILVWVRAVASVLIAGVVVKLLLAPSGALASIPGLIRLLAILVGVGGFFIFKRSVMAGLITGEIALILGGYLSRI